MTKRIPYQFAVVGQSGKGKTMSFRNMNPETCAFINMEGKPLPFENKFKYYFVPQNWQECYQILIECAKNPEITEVILESFSAYFDSLLKTARETKKGLGKISGSFKTSLIARTRLELEQLQNCLKKRIRMLKNVPDYVTSSEDSTYTIVYMNNVQRLSKSHRTMEESRVLRKT